LSVDCKHYSGADATPVSCRAHNNGATGFFGTSDDAVAPGRSTIGDVTIAGSGTGSNLGSETFRIATTGEMGSVTVGGTPVSNTGNFSAELISTQPLPIQVESLKIIEESRVYTAEIVFNQPIDSSTLGTALTVSEVRGSGEINIRLINGQDYTITYVPEDNAALIEFSRDVTQKSLPQTPGVPGPGIYRFALDADLLRAQLRGARVDGDSDGFAEANDDYSADDIVGDAGDKLVATTVVVTNPVTNTFVRDGERRYQGIEFEGSLNPDRQWSFNISVAYLDAVQTKAQNAAVVGKQVPGTTGFQIAGSVEYQPDYVPGLRLFAGVHHSGRAYGQAPNTFIFAPVTLGDAGIAYTVPHLTREVKIQGNISNITDKWYWIPNSTGTGLSAGAPRTFSLSIGVSTQKTASATSALDPAQPLLGEGWYLGLAAGGFTPQTGRYNIRSIVNPATDSVANGIQAAQDTGWELAATLGHDFGLIRGELEVADKETKLSRVVFNDARIPIDSSSRGPGVYAHPGGRTRILSIFGNALLDRCELTMLETQRVRARIERDRPTVEPLGLQLAVDEDAHGDQIAILRALRHDHDRGQLAVDLPEPQHAAARDQLGALGARTEQELAAGGDELARHPQRLGLLVGLHARFAI